MKNMLRILVYVVTGIMLFGVVSFFWLRHDKNYEKLYGYVFVNLYETQKTPLTIHEKLMLFKAYIDTRSPNNLKKAMKLAKEFDDIKSLDWRERCYLAAIFGKIAGAADGLNVELMVYAHFLPYDKDKPLRGLFEASAYFKQNDRVRAREALTNIKPLIKDNKKFQMVIDTMIEAIDNQKTTPKEFNQLFQKNLELNKAD